MTNTVTQTPIAPGIYQVCQAFETTVHALINGEVIGFNVSDIDFPEEDELFEKMVDVQADQLINELHNKPPKWIN
jgi:hypothetical protein